jgi:hypothetical protein
MNIGGSNRLPYDVCAYQKKLYESTSPLGYQLAEYKFENCTKCRQDKFYRPFDLVDVESELKNITRLASKCPEKKYNPNCPKSKTCLSTFDPSVPVVLAPEVCPIIFNNIPRMRDVGYRVPNGGYCGV